MTGKKELVAAVAEKAGLTKKDAEAAVNAVFASVTESLQKGEGVQMVGFGSFVVRERAERTGKNLRTGETIVIPAAKVPAFKAGKALKDALAK